MTPRSSYGFIALAFLAATAEAAAPVDLVFTSFAQPCRVVDTRLGGGPLTPGFARPFKIAGSTGFAAQGGNPAGCGVPTTASAVSMNVIAVNPQGAGNLRAAAYPNDPPAAGSIINYQLLSPNLNVANGLTFSICDRDSAADCDYDIKVQPNGAGVHLVVDILGIFTSDHKHSGEDITTGTIVEARIDHSLARDSEIMSIVTANDGSGSELDADLLDGMNASSFAPSAHDHDTEYQRRYVRTVVVSPVGADLANGSALLAALSEITTATATDRFLLKIEPGVYDLGSASLTMAEFVDIEGSGQGTTRIRSANSSSTVNAADDVEIRDLTIENTGISGSPSGMYANSVSPRVTRVTFITSGVGGPLDRKYGFRALYSNALLRDVTALVSGSAERNTGIWFANQFGSFLVVELDGIVVRVSDATRNEGISISHAPTDLHNIRASVFGGTDGTAVVLFGNPTVGDSIIANASGAQSPVGMSVGGGPATLTNVKARATGNSLPVGMKVDSVDAILSGVIARAEGSGFCSGIALQVSNLNSAMTDIKIYNSTLIGSCSTLRNVGLVRSYLSASQLLGGLMTTQDSGFGAGTNKCAGVSDENNDFFASTCP